MKFQEVIEKRHSIREFEKKGVPNSVIKKIIQNASMAPSAGNRQPWNFYCVNSKEKRDKITLMLKETLKLLRDQIESKPKNIKKIVYNFYSDLGDCQNIIFVFREKSKKEASYVQPNDIASIACAVENLMLSAVEKGLGTCWIGSFKEPSIEKKLKELLKTKPNEELIASILVGYPKKGYKPLIREKKKLSEVLKFR
jgi:nitroreductase